LYQNEFAQTMAKIIRLKGAPIAKVTGKNNTKLIFYKRV
jgi:hypothetical protein